MTHTILILGAGSGGGNNLIRVFRQTERPLRIIGSNCLPHAIAKSTADRTYYLPESTNENYLECLTAIIQKEAVDLVIPNNDREVFMISRHRDLIPARIFLPPHDVIEACQDKQTFIDALKRAGAPISPSIAIDFLDNIEPCFEKLPKSEKYWVRPRKGSGSRGATWVYNADQGRKWIELWTELRGYKPSDFQISNFLPGRDYNFHSIWYEGKLIVGKLCERLLYFMGSNRLSGMSSTPEVARTIIDRAAIDNAIKAIRAISDHPHGGYNVDMKGDVQGNMCITEINIGRFPMIITIHDSVGTVRTAETYLKCAFGETINHLTDPIDVEEGVYLIRELDTEPLVIADHEMDALFADCELDWRQHYRLKD